MTEDESFVSYGDGEFLTAVTPDRPPANSRISDSISDSTNCDKAVSIEQLQIELEMEQRKHQETLRALRNLREGVRIITKQLKHQESTDDDMLPDTAVRSRTWSGGGASSVYSYASHDDRRLSDLTCSPSIGGDLLQLSQAASMVGEHARLSSEEATVLTTDVAQLHTAAIQATQRADAAETMLRKVYIVAQDLKQQLSVVKMEKKLLVREVKHLRQWQAEHEAKEHEGTRNGMLSEFETYVVGALQLHETTLKQAHTKAEQEKLDQVLAAAPSNEEYVQTSTRGTQTDPAEFEIIDSSSLPSLLPVQKSMGFGPFGGAASFGFGANFKNFAKAEPETTSGSFAGRAGFGFGTNFKNFHSQNAIAPSVLTMRTASDDSPASELITTSSSSEHSISATQADRSDATSQVTTKTDLLNAILDMSVSPEKENRPYSPIRLSYVKPVKTSFKSFSSYRTTTPTTERSWVVPTKISIFGQQSMSPFQNEESPTPDTRQVEPTDDTVIFRSLSLPEEISNGGRDCPVEISTIYSEIQTLYEC